MVLINLRQAARKNSFRLFFLGGKKWFYTSRESIQSAGVVSRIATTRKKVEGIKRCSLLFDRERRRFLFAKRAFSRFDNFASFGSLFILLKKMLLRYFSFFVLRSSKYHFYHIRPVSFGLVVEKRGTKKRERTEETKTQWGIPFFLFFSSHNNTNEELQEHKMQQETRDERAREKKTEEEEKKSPPTNTTKKKKREEEEEKKGAIVVFVFICIERRLLSLLEIRESSSLDHHHAILLSEREVSRRKREREREFARFSFEGRRAILLLGNFKRL